MSRRIRLTAPRPSHILYPLKRKGFSNRAQPFTPIRSGTAHGSPRAEFRSISVKNLTHQAALLSVNVASAVSFLTATLLIRLRLRRQPDPWRRTVGVGLRSEATKFALSAFGLRLPSSAAGECLLPAAAGECFAERFAAFLQGIPAARYALRHDRFCSDRVENPHADVTLARFASGGELQSVWPVLDDRHPVALDEPRRLQVEAGVVEEYNRSRALPERVRPAILLHNLNRRWLKAGSSSPVRSAAVSYGERILKSCCVSFQPFTTDSPRRFEPPDFRFRRIIGSGLLNLVCRRLPSGAVDVWMQVHHAGADGVAMQDLLTSLENAWGTEGGVLFPSDTGNLPEPKPCFASPQERPLYLITDFIDFTPLILLRKELRKRFAGEVIENISVHCLFLWCLACQPEFDGVKFANAVDVPANDIHGRAVDLVAIRPADYMNVDRRGFSAFVRDFNQLIVDARARRTTTYEAMRNLALLPPVLASTALRLNPERARSTFGTVGVSIVKDAKVVVGTMADQGFDGGFILIGSMSLPGGTGRSTTAVSIKGEYAAICRYPAAIRRTIQTARTCFGLAQQG
jgi:hypothetical protein